MKAREKIKFRFHAKNDTLLLLEGRKSRQSFLWPFPENVFTAAWASQKDEGEARNMHKHLSHFTHELDLLPWAHHWLCVLFLLSLLEDHWTALQSPQATFETHIQLQLLMLSQIWTSKCGKPLSHMPDPQVKKTQSKMKKQKLSHFASKFKQHNAHVSKLASKLQINVLKTEIC